MAIFFYCCTSSAGHAQVTLAGGEALRALLKGGDPEVRRHRRVASKGRQCLQGLSLR
jgi:hypothetical protein